MRNGREHQQETTPAAKTTATAFYEIIDAREFGRRLSLPVTWVRNHSQPSAADPIPCKKLGRYTRYEWLSPELQAWWERQSRK